MCDIKSGYALHSMYVSESERAHSVRRSVRVSIPSILCMRVRLSVLHSVSECAFYSVYESQSEFALQCIRKRTR